MKNLSVVIQGTTPILFNRMGPEALINLRIKKKQPKGAVAEFDASKEAEGKLYMGKDGKPYLPAQMLLACLIGGGRYCRLEGKRQMSTKDSSLVPGFLAIHTPQMTIKSESGWRVDIQQGRNPNGGEAVCIVRPAFDQWEIAAEFAVDDEQVGEQQVRQLFDISLGQVGLGDFRPQRKGYFGMSKVKHWKLV